MKLLRNIENIPKFSKGTVAAIGNFDGVHRGHQALLAEAHAQAKQLGLPMLVIIFEPQPREYFLKDKSPPRLSRLREKIQIFQKMNVDYVCCLRFNRHLAQMDASSFAHSIVFSKLQVKYLYVGDDFRFGCDRLGDGKLLQHIGLNFLAQVTCYPDFKLKDHKVSSTLVRHALQIGDLDQATTLLGRPYTLSGRVIYGDGLGKTWGVPTANLKMTQNALSLRGVFCVQVLCDNGYRYNGIANIGCRPTLDGTKSLLEVHLFQFNELLYGRFIEVSFLYKIREEMKFSSREQLIEQIHTDVIFAKDYFKKT